MPIEMVDIHSRRSGRAARQPSSLPVMKLACLFTRTDRPGLHAGIERPGIRLRACRMTVMAGADPGDVDRHRWCAAAAAPSAGNDGDALRDAAVSPDKDIPPVAWPGLKDRSSGRLGESLTGTVGPEDANRARKLNHYSTTNSRKPPDLIGPRRTRTRSTPDRIHAGQGLFPQVVAGVGFEPT